MCRCRFSIYKSTNKDLFLSLWKRMKIYLHRRAGCWEINKSSPNVIIQIQHLGGWYILSSSFPIWTTTWKKEECCPKGGSKYTWYKAVLWSTLFDFLREIRIEYQERVFLEEQYAQEQEQGRGHQQMQQTGLGMECYWELSAGMYWSQINCIALAYHELDSPTLHHPAMVLLILRSLSL